MGFREAPVASRPGLAEPGAERTHKAEAQLAAIESFGAERARWLKVAAGVKAKVLEATLRGRPLGTAEIVLELGGFVGYSATRLATAPALACAAPEAPLPERDRARRVVSVEKNAGCALLARTALDSACLACDAEVWTGRAADLLPRVLEEYGEGSVGLAFFDHSGSAYLDDLLFLERGMLGRGAVVVADNVLKPGAPYFLWHVVFGGSYDVTIVSLPEFAQTAIEDWIAVCVWRGPHGGSKEDCTELPNRDICEELGRLAWWSDSMRRRSERGGVDVAAWAAFAREMRERYRRIGLEAVPWQW